MDERVAHEHALAEEPSLEGDAVDSFTGGQGGYCCCFDGEDKGARVGGEAVAEHAAEEVERAGREAGAEEAAHHGGEHIGVGALGALGEDGGGVGGARRVGERAEGEEAGGREAVRGEAGDGEQRLELEEAPEGRAALEEGEQRVGHHQVAVRVPRRPRRRRRRRWGREGPRRRRHPRWSAKPARARPPRFDWPCELLAV